jgi:hypothetical protein
MEDAAPDDTLRWGGPYTNGTACALNCTATKCVASNPTLGPFSGVDYQTPVVDVGVGGAANGRFSHITWSVGPRVNRLAFIGGALADLGTELSPTRFMIYATGEEDGSGNVVRYRELLQDTGYLFAGRNDSCLPPFPPPANSGIGAQPFVFFEPIDFNRCFEVVVMSPCKLTRWFYQMSLRIVT